MIAGVRRLPVQHLSIRVPWHDAGWAGVVCNKPASNIACRTLRRIADAKDDSAEAAVAGRSLMDLSPDQLPACKLERSNFMAPFPITVTREHPYVHSNSGWHGHFLPTRYTMQPYSAACVPFRWMLHKEGAELVERYNLGFQPDREPDLGFDPDWIQDRVNQLVMLDTFFGAVQPGQSLCFFYAKDTPLSASTGRVIVGVGLVRDVGAHVEYEYSTTSPPHRSVLWERNVEHSIRPGFEEGFVFPYQELSDLAVEKGVDPEQFLAFAPDDAFWSFSYASEHVSHDHAIAAVLNCMRALDRIEAVLPGPWRRAKAWLDQQLNRLWRLRGPFPGFGSALSALLGDGGNLVAYELAEQCAEGSSDGNTDPWPAFEAVMRAPQQATGSAKELIGEGFARAWQAMRPERKELLKLLSRFSIEASQAGRFFDPDQRPIGVDEVGLTSNPYLLYELDRLSNDPVQVMTIDRGMLPDQVVLEAHPLPERSRLEDKIDPRRVRAFLVAALEHGAEQGHTLLPRSWLKASIDKMPLETDCPVGPEVIAGLGDFLVGVVDSIEMADGSPAYQLQRFTETARLIRRMVQKRLDPRSRRHQSTHDFRTVVDESLRELPLDSTDLASEERARTEKAAALAELFASRLSVLVGGAGTGKTTLLKMLCGLSDVSTGGVLLLAPTGKARVQLETKTEMDGGLTIAQFLMRYGGRYDPDTGRYRVTKSTDRCGTFRTVIVDECSMLTEEQLAALLDGLSGVDRLILVGDPSQLPPIGSGRPLVDIVGELRPEGVEHRFPRVGRGYAELTVPRRQKGKTRADLLLASWFGDTPDPAADEIWDRLETEELEQVGFESWSNGEDLHGRLLSLIAKELKLAGADDEVGFECSLGATMFNGGTYFWRSRDDRDQKAERWQIISPVRGAEHGVDVLNRIVQQSFRSKWMAKAMSSSGRKVHRPLGAQGIIYGDKVINLKNSTRRRVYPERQSYVANGDVGIVVGNYKRRKHTRLFPRLEVEFTSQPGHAYDLGWSYFVGQSEGKAKVDSDWV